MSDTRRMAAVVESLDWDADVDMAPLLDPLGEFLRSRYGDGAVRWVAGAVEESLTSIQREIQDSLAPRPLFQLLSQQIAVDILFDLAGDDSLPPDLLEISPDLANDFVSRGIPPAEVVAGLRQLQHQWLVWLTEAALKVDPEAPRLIPEIAASVTTTMDSWVEAMATAMVDRRRQVARVGEFRARAVIEAMVAGAPVDTVEAAALLQVPLDGWHLCCVVGAEPGLIVDRAKIDITARSLTRCAGVDKTVRYETSRGRTHLWVASEDRLRTVAPGDLEVPEPLVVGIGEPRRGLPGSGVRSWRPTIA